MKIAVFYHCILSGDGIPSGDQPINILIEQLYALKHSGLEESASELHIGVSGKDSLLVASICSNRAVVHDFGERRDGERPTMQLLQSWLPGHGGWAACYHHMKGVSHANDAYRKWRKCMERNVIYDWQRCVAILRAGYDTVGAHWMSHKNFHSIPISQRYWGGNFWWATVDYLLGLPVLSDQIGPGNRYYEGEVWIGSGRKTPHYFDMAPHFPQTNCS